MLRLAAAVAAVAVAAALIGFGVVGGGDDYPDHWDERVTDLVAFVEHEHGQRFDHPVPVDFLSEDEYAERTRTDDATLTDDDREDLEETEGLLRALGLVAGDIDLLESTNDLSDTGTLAFYDIPAERVSVRGTDLTPDVRVTLVHELTHALQAQAFDLRGLTEEAADDATSGEQFALRALVEGDATRIENAYVAGLSDDDRQTYEDAQRAGLDRVDAEDIPVALQALFSAPYPLGEGFVSVVEARQDVDHVFDDLPTTEEQILDPVRYLEGDDADAVDTPDVGDAEVTDEGDFGAVSLLLVLAERVELTTALDAALGWGGDAYATFERDGATCVRLAVTGDDGDDTDQLASALDAWVAAAPDGSASTSRDGDLVELESCDPGDDAVEGSGAGIDALTLAAVRIGIEAQAVSTGAEDEQAECFADAVVHGFTLDELTSDALPPDFQARLAPLADSCR